MAPNSLRDFLAALEKRGELAHVKKEVDRRWEVAAVMRKVLAMPHSKRPAVIFDNVAGSSIPVVVGLYLNRRRYGAALGAAEEEIVSRWEEAVARPIAPRMVASGPCKEVILKGDRVDLTMLPVPTWSPDKDAAPYLTAQCIIARDPETGYLNVGTYRMMYRKKDQTSIFVNPIQDIGIIYEKYKRAGKPMPIAVSLGVPPAMNIVSTAKVPHGLSEFDVAGGLIGEPLELTTAESCDLPVPAQAEIVLEGEVPPDIREREGPFGEFGGFMSHSYDMPVFQVKAITHRRNPIYHALVSQRPPSESSLLRSISNGALVHRDLKALGIRYVTGVHLTEAGCSWYHYIVAIKKGHPAHPRVVMNAIWASKPQMAKLVIVLDDDVDIYDPFQVEWALATRVQPHRDVVIFTDHVGQMEDPSQPEELRHLSSKMGIDATKKHPYPEASLPDQKYLDHVRENWEEYGVEEIDLD